MKLALAALFLIACGHDVAKPPPELNACNAGNGSACFVVGVRYHLADGDQKLDRAVDVWSRGCELGNAASCGQLGTIYEFGMGGHAADKITADRYYTIACHGGDEQSCRALGITPPPPPFDWTAALDGVLGPNPGELGASFGDYHLGAAVPAALATWEKSFHARAIVRTEDATLRGSHPSLKLRFEGQHGLGTKLVQRWGRPSLSTGAWVDAAHNRIAYVGDDGEASFVEWMPYKSLEDLVAGLDPAALLGATIDQVQQSLGTTQIFRDGEDDYSWYDYGTGPIETHATVARGKIAQVHMSIITNDGRASQWLVELIAKKYGPPRTTGNHLAWPKQRIFVEKPAPNAGNVDLDLGSPRQ